MVCPSDDLYQSNIHDFFDGDDLYQTVSIYMCRPFTTLDLPLLSSLVVRDHYSVSADNQHPIFELRRVESSSENVWGHQMDQLFTFKMSEVLRVLFSMRLLMTGPEVEKGFTYSEVCTYM